MNRRALAAAALLLGVTLVPALALDPRHPDWPCQQLKVPGIAVSSLWSGPPVDINGATPPEAALADLAARLAARRTPIEEARKLIAGYLFGTPGEREAKGKALFVELYQRLNGQRDEVMSGIERFSRKQKGSAEGIRERTRQMQKMQDEPSADPAEVERLATQLAWETRIFEDRQKATAAVCEVPVIIEKRLFDLGKAIQDALPAT